RSERPWPRGSRVTTRLPRSARYRASGSCMVAGRSSPGVSTTQRRPSPKIEYARRWPRLRSVPLSTLTRGGTATNLDYARSEAAWGRRRLLALVFERQVQAGAKAGDLSILDRDVELDH